MTQTIEFETSYRDYRSEQ